MGFGLHSLGTLATLAGDLSPIGATNAVVNKLSGGHLGFDPTPGFSAQNVATTQAGNALAAYTGTNQPAQTPTTSSGNANYTDTSGGTGGTTSTQNTGGTTYTDSSGNQYTSAAAAQAADQAAIQQATDQYNTQLNRLPGQLDIAKGNIQGQFNTNQNEINSGEQQAHGQYDQSTNQNHQQFVTNKNSIQDQASAGLHGLLRLLGMHGAGGSSDYLQAAPQAVAQQATQQRAGAGQTFGQNQQGLDTNWNNYETGVGQSKQKLNDWLSTQLNSAQSQSDQARQGILQNLAGLQTTTTGAQPYLDQINGLQGQIDNLGRLNPTYDGKSPTYSAPSVASYTVNPTAAPKVASNALDNVTSPYLGMLLGNLKDKQQQPSFGF